MRHYDKRGSYRAFREEFVDHMLVNGGWPDHATCADLLRARKRPTKREHISALRSGDPAPSQYARNLVELLLEEDDERVAHSKRVLHEYLGERGFTDMCGRDIAVVLSQVCTPPMSEQPDGTNAPRSSDDLLRNPIAALAATPAVMLYKRYIAAVGFESAEAAARWTYVRAGQDRTPDGGFLTDEECIQATERIIGLELGECARRFHDLAEREPWSVLFARKRKAALGVSVAVPVTGENYEEVRAGKRSFLDILPEHVESPSNHVVFIALAENPALANKRLNPTKLMLLAAAAQYAALMRCGTPGLATRYRVLAPEGTPKNRDRMLASQFRALSTRDPRNGSRIWERQFDVATGEGLQPIEEVILQRIGKDAPDAPPRA